MQHLVTPEAVEKVEDYDSNLHRGGRISGFDRDVQYSDDVLLGAYSIEALEDVWVEDLEFSVLLKYRGTANDWLDAVYLADSDVEIRNVRLELDGEVVAYADDRVEFKRPRDDGRSLEEFDFDGTFFIREGQSILTIVGDLGSVWSHLAGARLQFALIDADDAEGVDSERDYTMPGEFFSETHKFLGVTIVP